jgi:hypothetical protein
VSDSGNEDKDSASSRGRIAGGKPVPRDLKLPVRVAAAPPWISAAGRQAQQAARDGVAAVRKETTERASEVTRKAKESALPHLANGRNSIRRRVAVDPAVAEQVTLSLITAMLAAAGKHTSNASHPAAKVAGAAITAVGPAAATHTARQVRIGFEKSQRKARSTVVGPVTIVGQADDANAEPRKPPAPETRATTLRSRGSRLA